MVYGHVEAVCTFLTAGPSTAKKACSARKRSAPSLAPGAPAAMLSAPLSCSTTHLQGAIDHIIMAA